MLNISEVNEDQLDLLDRKLQKMARKRVRRGVKLLNKRYGPNWPEHIRLSGLDLSSGNACVLGQLAPQLVRVLGGEGEQWTVEGADYGTATALLWPELEGDDSEIAGKHGFCRNDQLLSWRMLNDEWEKQIGVLQRGAWA